MTPERWEQVSRLYHAAPGRDVTQRASFLADACAGDEALRHEVESLAQERSAEGFLAEAPWTSRRSSRRGSQARR